MNYNIDDITLVFDLSFDELWFFFWRNDDYERIDFKGGIRIGTIGITANTHQVLNINTQMDKPIRQHIPIRVPSFPTDWLLYAMRIPVQG